MWSVDHECRSRFWSCETCLSLWCQRWISLLSEFIFLASSPLFYPTCSNFCFPTSTKLGQKVSDLKTCAHRHTYCSLWSEHHTSSLMSQLFSMRINREQIKLLYQCSQMPNRRSHNTELCVCACVCALADRQFFLLGRVRMFPGSRTARLWSKPSPAASTQVFTDAQREHNVIKPHSPNQTIP